MGAIASQITSLTIVYSIVYSDADQRRHQSSASLAFVRWIHWEPVNSPHKWPVTRKMTSSWSKLNNNSCSVHIPVHKFDFMPHLRHQACPHVMYFAWWRHQMETFFALLAFCAGNSPVTGEFPTKKASDAELWCFLWSAPAPTDEQTMETPVIWDATALIMTSL